MIGGTLINSPAIRRGAGLDRSARAVPILCSTTPSQQPGQPSRRGVRPSATAGTISERRAPPPPPTAAPLLPPLLERPAGAPASGSSLDSEPALPVAARGPFSKSAEVVVMVLGGGPGNELRPLTDMRAEPAMPVAGLFRLIDIPLSNCINSGLNHIYVLAQYNSTSLNRHLCRAYSFVNGNLFNSSHGDGHVDVLNATQTPGHVTADAWFAGTADAVRHYTGVLAAEKHAAAEDVLILSGDQLYRMDYEALINYHRGRGADVTIATTPADEDHALHLGILKVDDDMNVEMFEEKPPEATLHTMSTDTSQCYGLCTADAEERPYVASMGIYVFKKQVLLDLLDREFPAAADFSRDILPAVIGERSIVAYPHTTYWEDLGSLKHYYRAHMAMANGTLKLQLFDKHNPIYTEPRTLPPTKMTDTTLEDTLMGEGCRVVGSKLRRCVVGPCTFIDRDCDLQETVIFGADEFETHADRQSEVASGEVPLGIGAGSVIRGVIIDKNARIGRGVRLVNPLAAAAVEGRWPGRAAAAAAAQLAGRLPKGVALRDGVMVVKRNATIPDGTVVE